MRTGMEQVEAWIVDELRSAGEGLKLSELIRRLEASCPLSDADREPQKGHEHESAFAYRCRWAVTRLRQKGVVRRPTSRRGIVELADLDRVHDSNPGKVDAVADARVPQVWIFQANPKFYRILEALQTLDRIQFLTNRYKDRIQVGDIALLWMSGKYAGIYAEARIAQGVTDRETDGEDLAFWADPDDASTAKPRVVLAIERRFLGNPLLKTAIAATEGMKNLMILRQPTGTNFRVDAEEWEHLRPLLPVEETLEPAPQVLTWATKRARGGKIYDESCGEFLERFVAETFADGKRHARDEITDWFAANYPLFKPITVRCHIEKYTTNFRSRAHYNASSDHDLLYRVDDDWSRLRLYRAGEDPTPIYDKPDTPKTAKSKTTLKKTTRSPIERNRDLLAHLARFGELTLGDLDDLGLDESHLGDWLDALLGRRPETYVVTPLFLHLIEADDAPAAFTTRLTARFLGEHLRRHAQVPIPAIEEHVWTRFGRWHPAQPHGDAQTTRAYLNVPIREPRDVAATERLDLFAQLPPKVIGDLIREPDFLAQQQSWSADAASKSTEGPLTTQLRHGWKRPLMLSAVELRVADDRQVLVGEMDRAEVIERNHIIGGLPSVHARRLGAQGQARAENCCRAALPASAGRGHPAVRGAPTVRGPVGRLGRSSQRLRGYRSARGRWPVAWSALAARPLASRADRLLAGGCQHAGRALGPRRPGDADKPRATRRARVSGRRPPTHRALPIRDQGPPWAPAESRREALSRPLVAVPGGPSGGKGVTLGSLLRQMRRQRSLTQHQLARKIGSSQPRISRLENGYDNPTVYELRALERALERPLVERHYLDVLLPQLVERLILAGEIAARGCPTPPTDFAVEHSGRLVATPFLLETAQTALTADGLVEYWLKLADADSGSAAKPSPTWAKRDMLARKVAANEICVAHEQPLQLNAGYLDDPLPPPGSDGILQRNLLCRVQRPILPRPAAASAGAILRVGRFIPVLRQPIMSSEPRLPRHLLDDPVHAAVMLLATCSRFPSSEINAAIFDAPDGLLLDVEDSQRTWSGSLRDGVVALLHRVNFVCVRPFRRDGWVETTRLAFDDLVREELLSVNGPCVEVNEAFWSTVAANPGHQLNRGEKLSRARVSERLLNVLNGDTDG